jgi:hypothetical protein
MTKKGYLILAQNTDSEDYVRQAYALALSIKNTQSTVNSVTLATNDTVPEDYKKAFDHIVDIPWTDQAAESTWKIENKWKYYYMTPYDETVILDSDMIFTEDISYWWPMLSEKEIWITDKPRTFKGDIITSTKYRTVFESNNLPNVYTAFMYFKKTELTGELFSFINVIFDNWEKFFYEYLDETRPKRLSGDVAYALAIKLMGIENECFGINKHMPSFVHMKSYVQNADNLLSVDWTTNLPTYFSTEGKIKIGNYDQYLPFHYQVKSWLTDDILNILEEKAKSWNK